MAKVFTITEGVQNLGALKSGGQGSVYKGKRMGEILTAIKILPTPISSESDDDKNFISFRNEVEKLRKVNEHPNPNVVTILNSGITDSGNLPFIEMEYIEGPDLGELLKPPHDPVFTIKETLKVADHLSNALAHCHNANVKHGDIKSNNVKFNQHTGNYILLDFGLSVMSDEQRRTSIRHAGAIEFMAPEQNNGDMLFETDVYSFGVILFELLAGTVPFPLKDNGETARNAVMISHMETPPPNLLSLRRLALPAAWDDEKKEKEMRVPEWVVNMIYKCLEKQPAKRFKSGQQLQDFIHNGIIEDENSIAVNISSTAVVAGSAGTEQLQQKINNLNKLLEAKERDVLDLREQLTLKERELYQYKYSGNAQRANGVSKTAFLTVLIIAIGLAALASYNLFIKKETAVSGTTIVPADSLYSDTSTTAITNDQESTAKKERQPDTNKEQKPLPLPTIMDEPVQETQNPQPKAVMEEAAKPGGSKYKVISTAYFHDKPDESTRRNAYLTVNESVITALEEQNDFIYVVFTNTEGQTSRGWVSKKNLTLVEE